MAVQIVIDLALLDAPLETEYGECCLLCRGEYGTFDVTKDWNNLDFHKPDCPWRRARVISRTS